MVRLRLCRPGIVGPEKDVSSLFVCMSTHSQRGDDTSMTALGLTTALCGDYEACILGAIYPFSS
jgi:hypothetical protein